MALDPVKAQMLDQEIIERQLKQEERISYEGQKVKAETPMRNAETVADGLAHTSPLRGSSLQQKMYP